MRSYVALAVTLLGVACAQAFTIDTPYGGGHILTASGPNGDTVVLKANTPEEVNSTSAGADILNTVLTANPYSLATSRGADVSGIFSVDQYDAWVPPLGDGTNFLGSIFEGRLNTTDNLSSTRWVYMEVDKLTNISGTSTFVSLTGNGFQTTDLPYYYTVAQEPAERNGSNGYGAFNYHLAAGFAVSYGPGPRPYTQDSDRYAFLVESTGSGAVTIHDGVHWGFNGAAFPAPEPGTMAGIGVGLLALIRKRRARR